MDDVLDRIHEMTDDFIRRSGGCAKVTTPESMAAASYTVKRMAMLADGLKSGRKCRL